jgi:ABC-2 type transport system permease protein
VFAGIFVSWFDIMGLFNMESGWFWGHIVGRSLLSAVPGGWLTLPTSTTCRTRNNLGSLLDVGRSYAVFLKPEMWIGAVAGVAMLVGAIRLRRWRDDN